MGRLGLRELRGSMYADSNVAQQSEYGLYGTLTPGEVADARKGDDRNMDEEPSNTPVQDRLREIEHEGGVHGERDKDRDFEMER